MKSPRQRERPYRKPPRTGHGDIRKLTAAKAGTKADGPGKPRTKLTGGNA